MAKKSKPSKNGNGHTTTAERAARPRITEEAPPSQRLAVLKTYKIYIGGKFPRTESGRYYLLKSNKGEAIANVCLSTRKDFREAVVAARNAQSSWAGKSAYNRGQILYRIAEMLEGRLRLRSGVLMIVLPPVTFIIVGLMVSSLAALFLPMISLIQGLS